MVEFVHFSMELWAKKKIESSQPHYCRPISNTGGSRSICILDQYSRAGKRQCEFFSVQPSEIGGPPCSASNRRRCSKVSGSSGRVLPSSSNSIPVSVCTQRRIRSPFPTTPSPGVSQSCAVQSRQPVSNTFQSGRKATARTASLCHSGDPSGMPVSTSQTRTAWSAQAVANRRPSELKAIPCTTPE